MYKSLQAGRAIAALFVVLFHLGPAIASAKYFSIAAFSVPFAFGKAGVEFFFVLSGFIIFYAHRNDISRPRQLLGYVRKRCVRIYPAYWIIFISVFCLALASASLRNTVPHDPLLLLKSLLLIPLDNDVSGINGAPVLNVAWTLQYEMLFYASFALVIIHRFFGVALILAFASLYFFYRDSQDLAFPLSFLLSDYMWLFIMGMAVSLACAVYKISLPKALICAGIGTALFVFVAAHHVMGSVWLNDKEILPYGAACSLIVFGLVQAEDKGWTLLGNKWVQLLGGASYALYLIHYPLISVLCKVAVLLKLPKLGLTGALLTYVAILLACLAVSAALHVWIEKPLTLRLRNRRASRLSPRQSRA